MAYRCAGMDVQPAEINPRLSFALPLRLEVGEMIENTAVQSENKSHTPSQVRWMIRRDMPDVLRIEKESFEFPWSEEDFLCVLRQRNCIGMVAEFEGRVIGFMIYELFHSRMHLMSFAVARKFRRSGVGSQMAGKIIGKLSSQRRNCITTEIRETNLVAQLFFKSQGFMAVDVLCDYYEDTAEDAYAFEYRIEDQ